MDKKTPSPTQKNTEKIERIDPKTTDPKFIRGVAKPEVKKG